MSDFDNHKIVQWAGSDRESQDGYVGAVREITVDESNWDLRLHDGATPGGHKLINIDNGDARWQGRSPELDGIGPYTAEMRGFLVRRGEGEYRVRKIKVTPALTVQYPDGFDGDPVLGFAELIDQDVSFGNSVDINDDLSVGHRIFVADYLQGETRGHHLGDVTGDLTGDTFGVHTGITDGNHQGNVLIGAGESLHIDGGDIILDPGALDFEWIEDGPVHIGNYGVPIGTICMWSGSTASVPDGWRLCDGGGGTPDLRNKFIVGAGDNYEPGDQGGTAFADYITNVSGNHTHVGDVAGHTLTVAQIPGHQHGLGVNVPVMGTGYGYTGVNGVTGAGISVTGFEGGGAAHDHGIDIADAGNHTHHAEGDNRPPYYALCYIMHHHLVTP